MSNAEEFIQLGEQHIRLSAITRLRTSAMLGLEGPQHFAHFSDGGSIALSKADFAQLKKRLGIRSTPARKAKAGAKKAAA
jgi:hypothetical protein